jgi:hypothetical protein
MHATIRHRRLLLRHNLGQKRVITFRTLKQQDKYKKESQRKNIYSQMSLSLCLLVIDQKE